MAEKDEEKKFNLKELIANIKPLLKYFKTKKSLLIISTLMTLVAAILSAFIGYFCGAGLEAGVNGEYADAIKYFLINAALAASSEFLYIYSSFLFNRAQIAIARTLGYETYKKSMNLPAYAFEEMSSGKIINIVTNDTEVVIGSIEAVVGILSSLLTAVGVFIYILINSWVLGLEILVLVIIFAFTATYFTKRMKTFKDERKKENDKFTSLANETIRGIREIKTLGIKNNLLNNTQSMIRTMYDTSMKECANSRDYNYTSSLFYVLLESGTFIIAIILILKANLSTTFFVALSYYIYRFLWIFRNITSLTNTLTSLSVSFGRITDIIENRKYEDVKFGNEEIEDVKGVVEFRNVTFNYKDEDTILENFNITFEPNKKIAIVGASGGGKSTLFNLITRLFEPVEGAIYLDGIDIKDLKESELRKHISIIRQEPFIFNRTIKENFLILKEDTDLETIRKYCKMASIDEYIMSLPDQYDTVLGEGGVNLSGGQKQRLAIARTLLKKSKVVLLDEATSALDNESQEYIKHSIDALSKDHTVIIVAHRLSTIIDADIIYVIKDGKVYDSGTHSKLIKKCKYYQKLYQTEDIKN